MQTRNPEQIAMASLAEPIRAIAHDLLASPDTHTVGLKLAGIGIAMELFGAYGVPVAASVKGSNT